MCVGIKERYEEKDKVSERHVELREVPSCGFSTLPVQK